VDFQAQLAKQFAFIETSCREYDSGNLDEAFRIATALRVIFHQTGSSISLLQHLGATTIDMLSTWGSIALDKTPIPALTNIELDLNPPSFKCVPKLTTTGRFVARDYWWQGEPILVRGTKKIKRKSFVLWGANKDGGAHVDASLPADYQEILDGVGWSMQQNFNLTVERTLNLENGAVATLRQMACEVMHSPQLRRLAGL
jgi:hypothetical protein